MSELAILLKAPQPTLAKLKAVYDAQRNSGTAAVPDIPTTTPLASPATYLTEGLRRVLTTAVQRLAGVGGDPVVGLQTAFGGGKTHTTLQWERLAIVRCLTLPASR